MSLTTVRFPARERITMAYLCHSALADHKDVFDGHPRKRYGRLHTGITVFDAC
jgi:hypothetical protein